MAPDEAPCSIRRTPGNFRFEIRVAGAAASAIQWSVGSQAPAPAEKVPTSGAINGGTPVRRPSVSIRVHPWFLLPIVRA